jgi:hypothetical protein
LLALPDDVTHLAVSVGGNNALRNISILARSAGSVAEALATVADVKDAFVTAYGEMLDEALKIGLPTMVCTIYDVRLPDPLQRHAGNGALTSFNNGSCARPLQESCQWVICALYLMTKMITQTRSNHLDEAAIRWFL